jgi:hypothetical protein
MEMTTAVQSAFRIPCDGSELQSSPDELELHRNVPMSSNDGWRHFQPLRYLFCHLETPSEHVVEAGRCLEQSQVEGCSILGGACLLDFCSPWDFSTPLAKSAKL